MHTNLEEQSDQGLFVNLSNSKSLKINWKILFTRGGRGGGYSDISAHM